MTVVASVNSQEDSALIKHEFPLWFFIAANPFSVWSCTC